MTIVSQDWDRLTDSATAKVPGVSAALLKNEIFDVMHEFLTVSSSWLEDLAIPILGDGTLTYALVPTEGQIIRLAGVVDSNGCWRPALMPDIGVMSLAQPVTSDQTYTVTVVKTVVLPTEPRAVPDGPYWLLPVYGPAILDGVLGRLFALPGKSWSNLPQSVYHLKRFLNAIASARSATLARNTVGGAAWAFPRQFGRGTQRGGFSTSNTGGF